MPPNPPGPAFLPLRTAAITWVGAFFILAGLAMDFAAKLDIRVGPLPLYEAVMAVGAFCEVLASWRIWLWLRSRRRDD